ncbi:MAG: 2-C-methyl-D-erythritol 4-phosphate cytidylyltransferase, partial [Onishia taeanensis]
GVAVTDEASAVEALGFAPCLVVGRRDNLKITHPEDLALAAHVLAAQAASSQAFGNSTT